MQSTNTLEIVSSRVFPYSREALFAAFSDPNKLKNWWGPSGFTNTFETFDLRPGGKWKFVMHGPNGTDYPNDSTFLEVEKAKRVVFHHHGSIHEFTKTHTYEEVPNGTKLTWKMVFPDGPANEKFKDFIIQANQQNFDRLEAIMAVTDKPKLTLK